MKIKILTLFPDMIKPFFEESIMKRAVERNLVEYEIIDFRNFASGFHKSTDDAPFGGGAGMVLLPEPLFKALDSIDAKSKKVIFPTPSGKLFTQRDAERLSKEDELIFICGHYEGIDQRVIDEYVDEEFTIGDYVLTSGESATQVIIDAIFRLLDGAINSESLIEESFSDGLVEYPQYTRPSSYCQKCVPEVLLKGNHRHITEWRFCQRLEKTMLNRPQLLSNTSLSIKERQLLLKMLSKRND